MEWPNTRLASYGADLSAQIEQWHEEKQDTLRAINNEQVAELAAQFAQPETPPTNKKLIAAVQQRASTIEKQLGYSQ